MNRFRGCLARVAFGVWLVVPGFEGSGHAAAPVGLRLVATNFLQPTVLQEIPGTGGRLVVADQPGTVRIVDSELAGQGPTFADLGSRLAKLNQGFDERGLLGMVFHPKYPEVAKVYFYYSAPRRAGAPEDWDHTSHLSEFRVTLGKDPAVEMGSERVLLEIDEPYFNHNAGRLVFGPDGYLYIGVGDGGNANDEGRGHGPRGNGQDTGTLLGKILRIDVNDQGATTPYAIPADNPFAHGGGKPEIFAYGVRNPWGLSFDRGGAHELFASEVGQTLFEEVNIVRKGGNYGWNLREGVSGFNMKDPKVPLATAPSKGYDGSMLVDPIIIYKNLNGFPKDPEALGISVTGGFVYRGRELKELEGRYIFGDWSSHWALPRGVLLGASRPADGQGLWKVEKLAVSSPAGGLNAYVVAFGEDSAGELYVLTNETNALLGRRGKVYKLVAGR